MEKMKELSQILDDMISAGKQMIEAATSIKEYFSSSSGETAPVVASEKEKKTSLTKEDVRKLLVEKSNLDDGRYKPEVKALVRKYSESETGNLGGVKPEKYEALVAELEVIGNS